MEEKILIVEDEEKHGPLRRNWELVHEGYRVDKAMDGPRRLGNGRSAAITA